MTVEQLTPATWCGLWFGQTAGWINVFAINTDGERQIRWAADPDAFARIVDTLNGGANIWFGCCTRHEQLGDGRRGGDDDCYEVPGVWLDIDIAGPHHKAENLPADRDEAISLLKDFPLIPSVVIDSGGGLHAYWLFDEPRDIAEVSALLVRWGATWQDRGRARGWHVDNVFDPARVLRVPGTQNHKSDPPKPVTTLHNKPDIRYTPDDLDEYTLDLPEPAAREERTTYDGPERVGDRYNQTADIGRLLETHGAVFDHADRNGAEHYRAPHHASDNGTTGIVVYRDSDGKRAVIYSETYAQQTGMELRRPYDAFGLYTHLEHAGNFEHATRTLEPGPRWEDNLDGLVDETAATRATAQPAVVVRVVPEEETSIGASRVVDGYEFIYGDTAEIAVRWGHGADVLWAQGESLMIVGPPGVGKTTIAHQLVEGLIGLHDEVLSYPVVEARRVLYLAMDRPKQIQRAIRRLFKDHETATIEDLLRDRLKVHRGPLIADLVKRPELLIELADEFDADAIFVDSLKDAAIKLSDDETGGMVNRAVQMCNAENVDVCMLHHQRKGVDGQKPNKLEDVFGSTWLTAGTGSVVCLWGEAGHELVELIHLKQPVDTVGPLDIEHDHIVGRSKIVRAFDVFAYLRNVGVRGATLAQIAQAEHGRSDVSKAQRKKTERRIRRLVDDGTIRKEGGKEGGDSFGQEAHYFLADSATIGSVSELVA